MKFSVPVAAVLVALVSLTSPAWAQSTQAKANPPKIAGTWALKLVTAANNEVPVVGEIVSETVSYEKITIDQTGTELELTEQVCDVTVRSSQSAVKTVIPDRFVAHIRQITRPGTLELEDGRWRINIPEQLKFFGVKPSIGTAKLPEDKNSEYVFDQDKDGQPGMTIELDGVLSGNLYVIQRSWDELVGKRYKSGQFAGPAKWHTDQIVVEKSGRIFGDMDPSKPVLDKSYFRLVPVDGDPSCEEIVQKKDEIF